MPSSNQNAAKVPTAKEFSSLQEQVETLQVQLEELEDKLADNSKLPGVGEGVSDKQMLLFATAAASTFYYMNLYRGNIRGKGALYSPCLDQIIRDYQALKEMIFEGKHADLVEEGNKTTGDRIREGRGQQ